MLIMYHVTLLVRVRKFPWKCVCINMFVELHVERLFSHVRRLSRISRACKCIWCVFYVHIDVMVALFLASLCTTMEGNRIRLYHFE